MSTNSSIYPTRYWHSLDATRIQCDLCPRHCTLKSGQTGLCLVRANQQQQVVLTTYGRSSGFCVDPIEKKPLNHFLPGTPTLSFGTAGCNLACKFCQNSDLSKAKEMDILTQTALPKTIALAAQKLGCHSVAYTYNDPVIFTEYAIDIAKECRNLGIKSVAVTAGYINEEPRREFFSYMDAANVDLKAFTEKFYYKLTGGHLQPVLDTLIYLKRETQVWLELTTLLIPGENDSEAEIEDMTQWVRDQLGPDVPLHFTAFHPAWKMLDKSPTPSHTLMKARQIAIKNGIRYVYTGNINDKKGGSTYCHQCDNLLIGRDGYELKTWHLTADGQCDRCHTVCAGIFQANPGQWGAKRLPVKLEKLESKTSFGQP